jgi:hypothetical protein
MRARLIAGITAPVVLACFFVATAPSGVRAPLTLIWGGSYVIAHVWFWSPLLATRFLSRRFHVDSPSHLIALMALCSIALTLLVAVPITMLFGSGYTWGAAVRDTLAEAVAAAGAFVLYRGLLRLNGRLRSRDA